MTQKNILVAGGAGYVGSHVCKALAASGYLPIVLDNFSSGSKEFVRFGPWVEGCISDHGLVSDTIHTHHIASVIDLSGYIDNAESIIRPLKYHENNVSKKMAFIETLQQAQVQHYIFSSSAAVYAACSGLIAEDHPLAPATPYGQSKLMIEQVLTSGASASGMRHMILRYFNAAGASPDGDLGESHDPETHLIPRACQASLGKLPVLDVYGDDYPTPDGTAIRDYVHVCDLASAHVAALAALQGGSDSSIYNLGSGKGTSIRAILECFESMGMFVPHAYKPKRPGDADQLVADIKLAQNQLDWHPVNSDIRQIIQSAYKWHAAH